MLVAAKASSGGNSLDQVKPGQPRRGDEEGLPVTNSLAARLVERRIGGGKDYPGPFPFVEGGEKHGRTLRTGEIRHPAATGAREGNEIMLLHVCPDSLP